jgi:hypothetical protein
MLIRNFDELLSAKRKSHLELWLKHMAAHPIIGQSEVFIFFLETEDGMAKWKLGKRKAEKDECQGPQWFCTITIPPSVEIVGSIYNVKERVDKLAKAADALENGTNNLMGALNKLSFMYINDYRKEFNSFGKKFEEFGLDLSDKAFDAPYNSELVSAIEKTGIAYNQIGKMYAEQVINHYMGPDM